MNEYRVLEDKILEKTQEVVSGLDLNNYVSDIVVKIYNDIGVCGLVPRSFVSGCVYLVSRFLELEASYQKISDITDSTPQTIIKAYKRICSEHPDFTLGELREGSRGYDISYDESSEIGKVIGEIITRRDLFSSFLDFQRELSEMRRELDSLEKTFESLTVRFDILKEKMENFSGNKGGLDERF